MRSDRTIVVVWLVLVLVAAAYEAIVGLDLVEFSNNPTEGAPGATGLLVVAIGAVGLGGSSSSWPGSTPRPPGD